MLKTQASSSSKLIAPNGPPEGAAVDGTALAYMEATLINKSTQHMCRHTSLSNIYQPS